MHCCTIGFCKSFGFQCDVFATVYYRYLFIFYLGLFVISVQINSVHKRSNAAISNFLSSFLRYHFQTQTIWKKTTWYAVTQGHWKWHPSIDRIQLLIGIPQ